MLSVFEMLKAKIGSLALISRLNEKDFKSNTLTSPLSNPARN